MVLILHAGWLDGRFVLWGERSLGEPGPRPRGRPPRLPRHPFAAGVEELRAAAVADGAYDAAAVAWLPTVRGARGPAPLPSSPLLGELDGVAGRATIAPWLCPALALTPGAATDLLAACTERRTLAPGIVVGDDLAYWTRVLRFAGDLVGRGRFVPGLVVVDGVGRAAWEAAPAPADVETLGRLARALPPVARALAAAFISRPARRQAALEAHPEAAGRVVKAALGSLVDALVRAGVAGGEAPPAAGSRHRQAKTATLHDRWLAALAAPDGALAGGAGELAALVVEVERWRRHLTVASGPYRLCFRLEEPPASGEERTATPPPEPAGPWQVHYLVQPLDDPSLLVSLADAWQPDRRTAAALDRAGADLRELLLAALGRAAGVSPAIEASLRQPRPAGFTLDTAGAHEFLTTTAPHLEVEGFGVLLPAWWTGRGTRRRLAVRAEARPPRLRAKSGLGLSDLVTVDWRVALGEELVDAEELEALARLKTPLVELRGQWVELDPETLRAALALSKRRGERLRVRELVELELGVRAPPGGLELGGVASDGPVGELLGRLTGSRPLAEETPPAGLVATLRPYQVRGYSWLAFLRDLGLGACLADDMGLGKTIQTLALVARERQRGERRPVLLVCPTSVVANWQHEAARFTPGLAVLVHHGVARRRGDAFAAEAARHALVLSTYPLLHRDAEHLQRVEWAGVVLDEAQNVKNAQARQAQAARSLEAEYRVALTGTPVENDVGELWSIFEFLNPGWLGSQASFRKRFFLPIQSRRDAAATERLRRLTTPFILRRLKSDRTIVPDLPDKLEAKVYCNLTKEQASLYRAVAAELEASLRGAEGIRRKGIVLATLTRLKQVCNHPAHLLADGSALAGRSGKLARLTEMLEEVLLADDRALVFSQFAEMGELLRQHLQETFGVEVPFLHGGVPKSRRDAMVARFQDEAGPPVFLLSLKAGGSGLNLTRASHVFHFDRWWNPAVENQATDRAYRIGQTRRVQVHKLLCAGTFEEAIDAMIERKRDVAQRVVAAGEGWLTELSNAELRELVALRGEALAD